MHRSRSSERARPAFARAACSAGGVSHKVTFEEFVSDDRLEQLYRDANIFVLPSVGENESFGIVQLEAMSHGLPGHQHCASDRRPLR